MNHACMHVHVETMNWLVSYCISSRQTNSSNTSQCLFCMYSFRYNVKQRAAGFYLVRSSSVAKMRIRKTRTTDISIRPIIAAYSILLFWVDLYSSNTYIANIASLNYSCGEEAVRKIRSPFHWRYGTQLKRVKKKTNKQTNKNPKNKTKQNKKQKNTKQNKKQKQKTKTKTKQNKTKKTKNKKNKNKKKPKTKKKLGTFLIEFKMFPFNIFKISHDKHVIHSISFDFV